MPNLNGALRFDFGAAWAEITTMYDSLYVFMCFKRRESAAGKTQYARLFTNAISCSDSLGVGRSYDNSSKTVKASRARGVSVPVPLSQS